MHSIYGNVVVHMLIVEDKHYRQPSLLFLYRATSKHQHVEKGKKLGFVNFKVYGKVKFYAKSLKLSLFQHLKEIVIVFYSIIS